MRSAVKTFLGLFALAALAAAATAQTPLGRMAGVVRDQSGGVIPGVTVYLTNELTNQKQNTVSSNDGAFVFPQLPVGSYAVRVEMPGFKTSTYSNVKVDPGQERSLTVILEVGQKDEVVQVVAGQELVNTTTPELNNTVTQKMMESLPLNGRNPIELIRLQAGVAGIPTRTNTAINGGRPSWTQVTQDGINIQDNFIRTNSLDFVPNRPTSDTIGEFTITTNNQGADASGGSSQVKLITPSGTNQFHGSLYEFNRNSALAASSWFANVAGRTPDGRPRVPKAYLNRHQFGGRVGGPVLKDKLFFFTNYEGFRLVTQAQQNNIIPVRDDFLNGVFNYVRPSDGSIQSVNVLQLVGVPADARVRSQILRGVPSASLVNNFDVGNSTATRTLNTAGYRFNQTDRNNRNQWGARGDYEMTSSHHFEFVFTHFRETDDRTDIDTIHARPVAFTDTTVKFFSAGWRWTATPRLNNELRIGANLAPVAFESNEDFSSGVTYTVPFITNRQATFQPQGRDTRTRQYQDNASYVKGNHSFQFGGSLQQIRAQPYNFAARFPNVSFGFSAAAPGNLQLNNTHFPQDPLNPNAARISPADLASANAAVSFLGGVITQVTQTFQVQDRSSGFVAGIPNIRDFSLDNWSFYFQDGWRMRPNLTLRLGLKWEYFTPLKEDNNLMLLPVLNGRGIREVMLDPNGTVGFVEGRFWNKDLNNFGPVVGFAWDPFKDGKTSVRGGYTLAFVNEESITVGRTASLDNAGLVSGVALTNQFTFLNGGVPRVPTPTFLPSRNYLQQLALSPFSAVGGIEPNLRQPYVHQFSFSISRELKYDLAVEGRYVGTFGRDIFRGIDLNQLNAGGAFLQDFQRARSNGFLSVAAGGAFNPAFNAAIPGSQPLTLLPNFGGGSFANANVINFLQTGAVGSLADFYLTGAGPAVGAVARAAVLANPNIYASQLVLNGAETDYNAFQFEVRRRFKAGISAQWNYTFSKVLANSAGTSQSRLEPFLDNARPQLERNRADFDLTHIMNANFVAELPFGRGKRWLGGIHPFANKVIGGWRAASIFHWQSGAPISLLAPRGTFNRGASLNPAIPNRSAGNMAVTSLTRQEIKNLFGIRKLPDGRVFYINPGVIDSTTGRGVGPDNLANSAGFSGQVLFNPTAGNLGTLQRLQFDGPSQFAWDFSLVKETKIGERIGFELRGDFFNFLNHPSFFVGDYDINSTLFGRSSSLNQPPRIIQVSAKITF